MFGWFHPCCPCDPAAKRWVEERLQWLSEQFGLHILLERPIILPTPEYFPDPWDGSTKAVRRMFRRVCEYMHVDPNSIELKLFNDGSKSSLAAELTGSFAVGTWSDREDVWKKSVIHLGKSKLDQPNELVGVMAHELSHQRLLGECRIERECFDNELLTDLTAVFHGFGVFLANRPHRSTGRLSYWPDTQLYMPEYLSEPMLGYAMAHIAWFRNESKPAWAKALRWTPRTVFNQGYRFLNETADSTFLPVRIRGRQEERD